MKKLVAVFLSAMLMLSLTVYAGTIDIHNEQAPIVQVAKTLKPATSSLHFNVLPDAGADYVVEGRVSIAVDTVRPTDYDAMFEVMEQLYPNIQFAYDYWVHSSNDDGREYLTSRMKTGTAANIMWDEAGELPTYLMQGWVSPITHYAKNDPALQYLPERFISDYSFGGELYALPHQAAFETVTFNMDLLAQTGLSLPGLEWSMDDYERYLRAGAALFNQGVAVGVQDLFEAYNRVCFYEISKTGGRYGVRGYNYNTKKMEVDPLITGAVRFRAWREMAVGVEGFYAYHEDGSAFAEKLGLSHYRDAWKSGKALMEDDVTAYVDQYSKQLSFNYKMWTMPNIDGKMPMHVDHCFITATTPADRMDACYQALRFMTISANGNMARLDMYEDANRGKYSLNAHVYYPVTTHPDVVEKFNNLSCTDEVDEYLLANIQNSSRYDTFKLVPELRYLTADYLSSHLNNITTGDGNATPLYGAAEQFNTAMDEAWKNFFVQLKKVERPTTTTTKVTTSKATTSATTAVTTTSTTKATTTTTVATTSTTKAPTTTVTTTSTTQATTTTTTTTTSTTQATTTTTTTTTSTTKAPTTTTTRPTEYDPIDGWSPISPPK